MSTEPKRRRKKTTIIRGNRWRVVDISSCKHCKDLGYCANIDREIAVPVDGDTEAELDTIIHEVIHASNWDLSEEAVEETATSISELLWSLGWRREII